MLPRRLAGPQAARRGRRRLLHPHVGDERRRSGAGAEDPDRVHPRDRGQAARFCARSSSGAASRSRRRRTSATTSTTRSASPRSGCPSCRPTPGRRSCRSRRSCSRAPAGTAACGSSATPSGTRSGRRRRERSALRPRAAASPSSPAAWASSGRCTSPVSPSAGCASRASTSRPATVPDGVRAYEVDVTDRASIARAVDDVVAEWGVPHVLVNNAGLDSPPDAPAEEVGPFEEYPEAVVRRGDGRQREGDVPVLPGRRWRDGAGGPRLDRQRLVGLRAALARRRICTSSAARGARRSSSRSRTRSRSPRSSTSRATSRRTGRRRACA